MNDNQSIKKQETKDLKSLIGEVKKSIETLQKNLNSLRIISCYKLSSPEINLLLERLPFSFADGARVENLIDKSLIAGVRVEYQSKVIDLSLKKKLDDLQKDLASDL
jgi:F0F1-type ATP synthase delta subunit